MAFKVIVFAVLIAVASAGIGSAPAVLTYSAPTIAKVAAPVAVAAPIAKTVVAEEFDPHPQYQYSYEIQDGLTGDNKNQQEIRDGDVVQGSYSVVDPDGTRRTVEYTADPVNGFNAIVHREPLGVPAVAKVAAPLAYAAPAKTLAYAAPVGHLAGYAGPAPLQYFHH